MNEICWMCVLNNMSRYKRKIIIKHDRIVNTRVSSYLLALLINHLDSLSRTLYTYGNFPTQNWKENGVLCAFVCGTHTRTKTDKETKSVIKHESIIAGRLREISHNKIFVVERGFQCNMCVCAHVKLSMKGYCGLLKYWNSFAFSIRIELEVFKVRQSWMKS